VCQEKVLRGRQTVCSGRCRAKRWRETHATRDPEIRAALEAIAQLVQVTLGRLETGAFHARWTIFAGIRPDLRLARRQLGGRLMAYLSVLLALGLAGPGRATALQFDSFSVSAFIEPPSTTGFPVTGVSITATAPGFSLTYGFHSQDVIIPGTGNVARIGCPNPNPDGPPMPCHPGDRVSASAVGFASSDTSDGRASIVFAGQPPILPCNIALIPLEGDLCTTVGGARVGWGSAVLPPFAGPPPGGFTPDVPAGILNVATVASTFSADFGVRIWEKTPGSFPTQFDSVGFTGTGPAQFDLVWQPDTGTWLPLFAEGRIDVEVTPEPATLLLFGTTGAGLGLARWYRRRGQQHAA